MCNLLYLHCYIKDATYIIYLYTFIIVKELYLYIALYIVDSLKLTLYISLFYFYYPTIISFILLLDLILVLISLLLNHIFNLSSIIYSR